MTPMDAKHDEMVSRISKHDRFYSKMIHLIPKELYLHTNSSSHMADVPSSSVLETDGKDSSNKKRKSQEVAVVDDAVNGKYYKHRKQPLTADERKLKSQANKKAKYSSENGKVEDGSDAEEDEEVPETADDEDHSKQQQQAVEATQPVDNVDASVKIEQLRKRLQDRIANMKTQRQTSKKHPVEKVQKKPVVKAKKVVPAESSVEELKAQLAFAAAADDHSVGSSGTFDTHIYDEADIEFGTMVDIGKGQKSHPSKRDGGKVQRIKKLLAEAEIKRERLRTLSGSKDVAEQRKAKSEQWQDVLKQAAGEKSLMIDPTGQGLSAAETKLKKALKKREKKKQKSAEEWGARIDKVKEEKDTKLAKREENIKNRKPQRYANAAAEAQLAAGADNKGKKGAVSIGKPGNSSAQGKASKNEEDGQKGRNRAGFEGKKVGSFLNAGKGERK